MAMVTMAEEPITPVIQLQKHDVNFECGASPKQCRYYSLEAGAPFQLTSNDNSLKTSCYPSIPVGAKKIQGRRANLEDFYAVDPNFTTLKIRCLPREGILPEALKNQEGSRALSADSISYYGSGGLSNDGFCSGSDSSVELYNNVGQDYRTLLSSFQYAAVFDGHGGAAVSIALAENLHPIMKKQLENMTMNSRGGVLTFDNIAEGLKTSFLTMNSMLGSEAKTVGSTGVVSMVSDDHIIVANCGDSRAVLWRHRQAFKLSRDHKPTHPDEQDRIVRAGGKVCNYNGIRVMGLLAMTRAFGDHCLSNFGIIAEPEVTIIERQVDDEFVILASDGLWDVVSDMEACALASRCFMRANERNASRDTAAKVASSVLIRVALDKGSSDNITVVVLDLRK